MQEPIVIKGNVPSKSNGYRTAVYSSPKTGKPIARLIKSQELKAYEESFGYQFNPQRRGRFFPGDFSMVLHVYYKDRRRDLDGSLKIILDCLQEYKLIKNDRHMQELFIKRHIDAKNPRIEFELNNC